jgi:hypothetical protein
MNPIIEQHRQEIEAICRRYNVVRLEVFGSAAGGGFDAAGSDVDFVVELGTMPAERHSDAYFGLLFDLEATLDRRVDLIELKAIRNPHFLASVNQSRTLLYAA